MNGKEIRRSYSTTVLVSDLEENEEFETLATHAQGRVIQLQTTSKSVIAILVYPDGHIIRRDLHANVLVATPYYSGSCRR